MYWYINSGLCHKTFLHLTCLHCFWTTLEHYLVLELATVQVPDMNSVSHWNLLVNLTRRGFSKTSFYRYHLIQKPAAVHKTSIAYFRMSCSREHCLSCYLRLASHLLLNYRAYVNVHYHTLKTMMHPLPGA